MPTILKGCVKVQHDLLYLQLNTYPPELADQEGDKKRKRR